MPSSVDFEYLYKHASCGLLTMGIQGEIYHANDTILDWLGTSIEAIRGRRFSDLLHKGGRLYFHLFVLPLLQMKKEVSEISLEIDTATGNFPFLFGASYSETELGTPMVNATVFRISDRKKYETELLEEKRRAEAEQQKGALALEQVAFDQAHLLRAPLANILGLSEIMKEQAGEGSEIAELAGMLQSSARDLDAVVRRIIEGARG